MASLSPTAVANQTIGCSFHGGLKPQEKGWLVMRMDTDFRPIEIIMLLVIRREAVASRKEKVFQNLEKVSQGIIFF